MEFLFIIWFGKAIWIWLLLMVILFSLLAFDLGVLHRDNHIIGVKESLYLSLFYIVISLLYGVWIYKYLGKTSATEFYTGYLVEKTLSLDNIFVISLIVTYFKVPENCLHRVLFWGIFGVIILRAIMIALGAVILNQFEWVTFVFAAFLIYTGYKMFWHTEDIVNIEENPVLAFLYKYLRVTPEFHGTKFFVFLTDNSKKIETKESKKLWVTPLFLSLTLIEFADIIFAVDSIPAIFLITQDPFIVYSSNIFAVLGLRALFFALSAIIHRFTYLKPALALVLIFIGSKVFLTLFLGLEKFPAHLSLGITLLLISGGIGVSLWKTKNI